MTTDRIKHRLAALLSADVVGYSRLMAQDEVATIRTLSACRDKITSIVGDMWHLPMQANSFDIVVVNQVLHHVPRADVVRMVAYLNAMARLGVVIADLRRSPLAVAGFRVASGILRLHQVTRHDGQVSLRRGFTHSELKHILDGAGIKDALVHRRPGWRLVAYWRTCNENG